MTKMKYCLSALFLTDAIYNEKKEMNVFVKIRSVPISSC